MPLLVAGGDVLLFPPTRALPMTALVIANKETARASPRGFPDYARV